MKRPPFQKVRVRLAKPSDSHLPWYDNTKLVDVTTCPTYGILRRGMNKVMPGHRKAQPLLAGSAMHEVFAAVALLDMFVHQEEATVELFAHHGKRIFGENRFLDMFEMYKEVADEDVRDQAIAFALGALETHGYVESEYDRKRTYTNLQEAAIAYVDDWEWGRKPIWIREPGNPKSDIGIEIPFDLVLTFVGTRRGTIKRRFTGVVDGIHTVKDSLVVRECKTAYRLNEAWQQAFFMSHQVTGYTLAASTWVDKVIRDIEVYGVQIPQPRIGGVECHPYRRENDALRHWFRWFFYAMSLYEQWHDDPVDAPKFTHSCNRYFRACEMIAFCDAPDNEKLMIIDEMEEDEWDPLKISEKVMQG